MKEDAKRPEPDDEEARRTRAARLRDRIQEAQRDEAGGRPPASARELTDRAAREAAAERDDD